MTYPTCRGLLAALVLVLAVVAPALAADPAAARFATVYKVQGTVQALADQGGTARDLQVGDAVYVGERVQASANGEAVLRTEDAGVIAVRPNAVFSMERFSAQGQTSDGMTLRIVRGALRLITGWTARLNRDNHRIVTPSATVGIRGTDHEPYVMSAELSVELQQAEGTYDKVNSGETVVFANGGEVAIGAGRVGFAPARPPGRTRALMTALMPTLLERVPGFYVAGSFDAELEELAQASMREAQAAGRVPSAPLPTAPAPIPTPEPAASVAEAATPQDPPGCAVSSIARLWLERLDTAIAQRDANAFIAQFDADAVIGATVRDAQGQATDLQFTRMELVKSTFAALAQLSEFASRRPVVRATLASSSSAAQCQAIDVESLVIESGVRNGGSYRVESVERFTLQRHAGQWLAVRAHTRQQ